MAIFITIMFVLHTTVVIVTAFVIGGGCLSYAFHGLVRNGRSNDIFASLISSHHRDVCFPEMRSFFFFFFFFFLLFSKYSVYYLQLCCWDDELSVFRPSRDNLMFCLSLPCHYQPAFPILYPSISLPLSLSLNIYIYIYIYIILFVSLLVWSVQIKSICLFLTI